MKSLYRSLDCTSQHYDFASALDYKGGISNEYAHKRKRSYKKEEQYDLSGKYRNGL